MLLSTVVNCCEWKFPGSIMLFLLGQNSNFATKLWTWAKADEDEAKVGLNRYWAKQPKYELQSKSPLYQYSNKLLQFKVSKKSNSSSVVMIRLNFTSQYGLNLIFDYFVPWMASFEWACQTSSYSSNSLSNLKVTINIVRLHLLIKTSKIHNSCKNCGFCLSYSPQSNSLELCSRPNAKDAETGPKLYIMVIRLNTIKGGNR